MEFELPKELKQRIELEEIISTCALSKMETIKKMVQHENQVYLQMFLYELSFFRPFAFQFLADIFQLTGAAKIKASVFNSFAQYLFQREIIQSDTFDEDINLYSFSFLDTELYEEPYSEESFYYSIINDDLTDFITKSQELEIDINSKTTILFSMMFDDIQSFVAYNGAINILKYLMLNGFVLSSEGLNLTVQGGSIEAVILLMQFGYSFHNMTMVAIQSHHNKLAKILSESYNDNIEYDRCTLYCNTEMFLYFLGLDRDKDNAIKNASNGVDYSVSNQDNELISFLKTIIDNQSM